MAYLNKRIEVKVPERGNDMKPTGRYTTIVGICKKEPGPNVYLDIPLMILLDRTPIAINSLGDIKILPH